MLRQLFFHKEFTFFKREAFGVLWDEENPVTTKLGHIVFYAMKKDDKFVSLTFTNNKPLSNKVYLHSPSNFSGISLLKGCAVCGDFYCTTKSFAFVDTKEFDVFNYLVSLYSDHSKEYSDHFKDEYIYKTLYLLSSNLLS